MSSNIKPAVLTIDEQRVAVRMLSEPHAVHDGSCFDCLMAVVHLTAEDTGLTEVVRLAKELRLPPPPGPVHFPAGSLRDPDTGASLNAKAVDVYRQLGRVEWRLCWLYTTTPPAPLPGLNELRVTTRQIGSA